MILNFCVWLIEWFEDYIPVFAVAFVAGLLLLFGWVIWLFIADARSPVIELQKTAWECTGTRKESTVIYVQSGKVMIPITTYHDVCVEYTRH